MESIGRDVQSKDDVDVAGRVPYVDATLDWVQVARRFPVRIRLKEPPEHPQNLGASAMVVFSPADAGAAPARDAPAQEPRPAGKAEVAGAGAGRGGR